LKWPPGQDFQESVVPGHDLAGFDTGDMPLRQSDFLAKLKLAPAFGLAALLDFLPNFSRQGAWPLWFHTIYLL